MGLQLPLSLGLRDSAVFANFVAGANAEALDYLQRCFGRGNEPLVYLWGESGSGKSHLLQALCHSAGAVGESAVYLPLQRSAEFPCEALNGLEAMAVVCLDDVDAVAGQLDWERALLGLFERVHASGCALAVTAGSPAGELDLRLPQLGSRLAWGMTFQLRPLTETGKLEALRIRARRRGLELGAEAARYLVRHYGADGAVLFDILERLDRASLVAKRRLTIPFIRAVLNPLPPTGR